MSKVSSTSWFTALTVAMLSALLGGVAEASPIPKSVALVYPPVGTAGFDIGMVQVTFTDGHQEFFDKSDKCGRPKISNEGNIGWSVWTDSFPGRYGHSYEILRLRTRDGALKEFKPNAYFIMDWGFADDGKAIVIESMEHHGPSYYIKYSIATGKVLDSVEDYRPYAELPSWAQPYSDEKP
jgi:hypothetical protein